MEKILAYKIVSTLDASKLEQEVSLAIDKGWQPHGSLSVSPLPEVYNEDAEYNQAMVRYEDKPEYQTR